MIASLMMYARPEVAAENARYWASIRSELAARGIDTPETLANDRNTMDVWTDASLVLSQTCGMPYRLFLHDKVRLVGTPDFGIEGCKPGYYRSPLVVRKDDTRETFNDFRNATFAFNGLTSQSGYAAAYAHAKAAGFWFENRIQSYGHAASAAFLAEGKADIAALDAVTWRMIEKYDAFAQNLRVLEWTQPTPGLPYITATDADVEATRDAVSAAINGLSDADRDVLGLRGFVQISKADYLAVPNPPAVQSALRRTAM